MKHNPLIALALMATTLCAAAQDSIASGTWTLQRCIDRAKQENVTLKRNRLNVRQAQLDVATARDNRLPSVAFSTNQQFSNRPFQKSIAMVSGSEVITTSNKNSYSGSYGISGSMTLYNGGQLGNNIKLQEINSQIAELNADATALTIEEDVTRAYVQILYAQEAVKQDSVQIDLSQAQWDRAKALFKAGLLNKADVAQLESQTANDRYQLVADLSSLDGYKLTLKQLLELDGDQAMNIADPNLTDDVLAPLPSKADVFAMALNLRPEIRAQQLAMDRSDIDVKIAKAGMKPTVNLSAGINTNNVTGNGNMFTQLKNQWSNSVGVSVNVPIWDHHKTKNAVAKARLEKENSRLSLIDTQKTLWKTIENYWQTAYSNQQRYVAAQEKVKAAQTSYELTSEQFRLGLKNIIELMTDKTTYSASVQQMLQAKYMAVLNAALLRYYAGEGIKL